MVDWTDIIIGICSILITGILIPLVRAAWKSSQTKLTKEEQEIVESIVETGVRWAKQFLASETGEKKKAEVLNYVSDKLNELNIKVSADDIDKMIESIYEQVKKEG